MNKQLNRNFNTYFIESRFISIIVAIGVVLMRFLMFTERGIPNAPINDASFIWSHIEPILQANPLLSFIGSTVSIFFIAFIISEINNRFGIIRTRTSMPFYIPLIIFSIHPQFLRFTSDFPALILVLWSMFPLLSTYQSHKTNRYIFQFSALLAMASVFQIYAILLVPVWIVALKALSEIKFKSLLASFFGVTVIYWITFAFYVFADNISGFIHPMSNLLEIYDFTQIPSFTVPQWGFIGSIVFIVIYFISVDNRQIIRERSFTKKALYLSMSIIIVSLLMHVLFLTHTIFWIYVAIAFLTIIIAHFYTNIISYQVIYSFLVFMALVIFYMLTNTFTELSPF